MSILEEEILMSVGILSQLLVRMNAKLDKLMGNEAQIKGEKLLDNQDMCFLLKVSNRTLQRYRNARILPFATINRKNYYLESDVQAFIQSYFSEDNKYKRKQLSYKKVREDK